MKRVRAQLDSFQELLKRIRTAIRNFIEQAKTCGCLRALPATTSVVNQEQITNYARESTTNNRVVHRIPLDEIPRGGWSVMDGDGNILQPEKSMAEPYERWVHFKVALLLSPEMNYYH
eukprot:Gregarina_sp_Poly_1__1234@NODE_12_length_23383_cov_104_521445_g10_i0_p16_GENE_NODE_12_length_23383_cov_104_521445_g10_i0NODE_12_length_23383_cov_104_521445_g10_i0_p16_ORF_typecomplete_len118_score11_19_NODE_12_length_23383_cov_104_521445_g10_i01884719200